MLSPSLDFLRGTNFIRSADELISVLFTVRELRSFCVVVGISVVSPGTANINWAELI